MILLFASNISIVRVKSQYKIRKRDWLYDFTNTTKPICYIPRFFYKCDRLNLHRTPYVQPQDNLQKITGSHLNLIKQEKEKKNQCSTWYIHKRIKDQIFFQPSLPVKSFLQQGVPQSWGLQDMESTALILLYSPSNPSSQSHQLFWPIQLSMSALLCVCARWTANCTHSSGTWRT